jgi:two-component system, OmpR family, response regulator CpxR
LNRETISGENMKIKVMLVDDEAEFLNVLAERLETRGIVVHKADSGDAALEMIQREDIDVIILDILMPVKDGITTLKEIKSVNPLPEVILLSGHATVQTAVEGLKLGAFDFLLKPTEISDLMDKIASAYKRKVDQENRIRNAEIQRILMTRSWD